VYARLRQQAMQEDTPPPISVADRGTGTVAEDALEQQDQQGVSAAVALAEAAVADSEQRAIAAEGRAQRLEQLLSRATNKRFNPAAQVGTLVCAFGCIGLSLGFGTRCRI
jgi:hypothetical protein